MASTWPARSRCRPSGFLDSLTTRDATKNAIDADRDVEEEHALPAEAVDQRAAHDRAEGQRHAAHAGPDADRLGALLGVGERLREDGQRARQQRRGAEALHGAAGDEEVERRRQRRQQRAGREDGQADEEDALAPVEVAERAAGEHEGGEDERVPVDHPLEPGHAGAEVVLDAGQGHVDDGVVEHGHEEGEAHRPEREYLGAAVDGEHGWFLLARRGRAAWTSFLVACASSHQRPAG